jgi:hypothetical protein
MPIGRRVFSDARVANFLIAAWNPNLRDSCQQANHNPELSIDLNQRFSVHFKRLLLVSFGEGGEKN